MRLKVVGPTSSHLYIYIYIYIYNFKIIIIIIIREGTRAKESICVGKTHSRQILSFDMQERRR